MAKPQWTKPQTDAITARGGTLLVSAAAGSGKTAVLVERVISLITDDTSPCNVDELLIVTFTNAAAAEMRARIDAALTSLLEHEPGSPWLRRQQLLLQSARISTIDSFCVDLLREQFHAFHIPQDFKILEQAQLEVLEEAAVGTVLERAYAAGEEGFLTLAEQLSTGRDDRPLALTVRRLYTYIMAHPFPLTWLREKCAMYEEARPPGESVWGRLLLDYARQVLGYAGELLRSGAALLARDEALAEKSAPGLLESAAAVDALLECAAANAWEETLHGLQTISLGRFVTPRGYAQHTEKLLAAAKREEAKKRLEELKRLFSASAAEHLEDLRALAPAARALEGLVRAFDRELMECKLSRGGLAFADIEHFALKLLVEEAPDGGWRRTALAGELSMRYREILVDEYQDTNEAQDMLFSALSREEKNLFLVGDVKQSIYRFRQAMPDIFLSRRERLPDYAGACPGRVVLGKNFRSRPGVAGMVNFVFSNLMSREVGELDYTEAERLIPGASYPPSHGADCEIHVLDASGRGDGDTDAFEAGYLAEYILGLVRGGAMVAEGDGMRPARFGDIAILLRSASAHVPAWARVLSARGVPVRAQAGEGMFAAAEIQMLLSLLRVIDNPMQDVPLLALLVSPLYGFVPDDLSDIRLAGRDAPFYTALVASAKKGNGKAAAVLADLGRLRSLCAVLPAGELVRAVIADTGLRDLAAAMPNPAERGANLTLMEDYAARFELAGVRGLAAFLRFLDTLERQGGTLPGAAPGGGEVAVGLMSIHRSKGLEFPICILAGTARRFNTQSLRESLLMHPLLGIGLRRRDAARHIQYDTIPYNALKIANQTADLSEALRVLYVAMTRAKERLVISCAPEHPEKILARLAARLTPGKKPSPFQVRSAGGDGDWLLTAALLHPDGTALRRLAGCGEELSLHADFRLNVVLPDWTGITIEEREEADAPPPPEEGLLREIETRLSYQYPHAALSGIASKRGASELAEEALSLEYFASTRPAFLSSKGLTPAQRGTALHKFMQFCRYHAARRNPREELARLVSGGYLSGEEGASVPVEKLRCFFQSPLAQRMFQSPRLYREQKFTTLIPASKAEPGLTGEESETVLVQGIADCVFAEGDALVIVDYKTDRVTSGRALAERYRGQMELYAGAMEKLLERPVKEVWLYSFSLETAVPVPLFEEEEAQLTLPGFDG